jgi:hypothetical protein
MAVLATVFQTGIDTLRHLRSSGDMMDQLRAATETLKRDLGTANHFTNEDNKPNQGLRLSDQRLDLLTVSADGKTFVGNWTPPRGGFFRIVATPALVEGTDADGLLSTRAAGWDATARTGGHYLHFTSILPGGTDQNLYSTTVAGKQISSPAAELGFFLDPKPTGYANNNLAVPLYNLVRRQRLVAVTTGDRTTLPSTDPAVISVSPSGAVNTLADLADPRNRLAGTTPQPEGLDTTLAPLTGARKGDDVLLSNVISFEVKVNWVPAPPGPQGFIPLPRPYGQDLSAVGTFDTRGRNTTDHPFDHLPPVQGNAGLLSLHLFDTWYGFPAWNSTNQRTGSPNFIQPIPQRIRVMAVQIKLRVYDPRMKNARQVTLVQDM